MADWRDELAAEIRALEDETSSLNPSHPLRALNLVRTLRAFEVRARALPLKADYRLANEPLTLAFLQGMLLRD